jgi:hypothetical protein
MFEQMPHENMGEDLEILMRRIWSSIDIRLELSMNAFAEPIRTVLSRQSA